MSEDARGPYRRKPAKELIAREAPKLPWPLMRGGPKGDLPDINVWLALALEEHLHHRAARTYWDKAQADAAANWPGQAGIWFCRTTMLGLVRVMSQAKVAGEEALTVAQAFSFYRKYRAIPEVDLLPDPPDVEAHLQALVSARAMPVHMWTDAWLAALSQAAGLRMVTFDKDFKRFNLENCLILPQA